MNGCVGMMWYNDSVKTSLNDKIKEAANYFKLKYGVEVKTVYVHRSVIEAESTISGFNVVPLKTILPNHMWLCPEVPTK